MSVEVMKRNALIEPVTINGFGMAGLGSIRYNNHIA
jgi:hypothetical protein